MLDIDDPISPNTNDTSMRVAAGWGLSSLIMGGILVLMAMIMLLINLQIFFGPRIWGPSDIRILHIAAIGGAVVMNGMALVSFLFGIRSLREAYHRGQPSAFGWSGTLVSLLALLLWIGTIVDLFAVIDTLKFRQGVGIVF